MKKLHIKATWLNTMTVNAIFQNQPTIFNANIFAMSNCVLRSRVFAFSIFFCVECVFVEIRKLSTRKLFQSKKTIKKRCFSANYRDCGEYDFEWFCRSRGFGGGSDKSCAPACTHESTDQKPTVHWRKRPFVGDGHSGSKGPFRTTAAERRLTKKARAIWRSKARGDTTRRLGSFCQLQNPVE